jgi:integrase
MTKGLADRNPIIDTEPADTKGARDRVLTDDELRSIWNSLGNDAYSDIVRLLALTGQRRGEIGSLRWSETDFDKAVIALPAERTKNSRPHDVPLSDTALSILNARPRLAGRDYVFASGAHGYRGWANNKIALDANIASKGAISPWRLHDLRRTVSTRMHDELAILPHIVEAVLNHVSGHKAGVAGTYNRALYAKEKAIALARWAEHLASIVGGEPSKVIAISKGRAR